MKDNKNINEAATAFRDTGRKKGNILIILYLVNIWLRQSIEGGRCVWRVENGCSQ
jgi:hypothetical protein